jgi:hypothetical protein
MSSHAVAFISCDVCKVQFRIPVPNAESVGNLSPVVLLPTARQVRILARHYGWRCRSWDTASGKMIDACVDCKPGVNWGREVPARRKKRKTKQPTL